MIDELIKNIVETEEQESERVAKHHIFTFLFGSLNRQEYDKISLLINYPDIYSLKYIYLLTILSITYQYKHHLVDYDIFFDKVHTIAKEFMTERNYTLYFQNFD